MTERKPNPMSRSERGRLAATPWRSQSVKATAGRQTDNAARQRKALKAMSEFELMAGISRERFDAEQAAMRRSVLSGTRKGFVW